MPARPGVIGSVPLMYPGPVQPRRVHGVEDGRRGPTRPIGVTGGPLGQRCDVCHGALVGRDPGQHAAQQSRCPFGRQFAGVHPMSLAQVFSGARSRKALVPLRQVIPVGVRPTPAIRALTRVPGGIFAVVGDGGVMPGGATDRLRRDHRHSVVNIPKSAPTRGASAVDGGDTRAAVNETQEDECPGSSSRMASSYPEVTTS